MEKKPQVINVGDVLVEFKRPVSEPPSKKSPLSTLLDWMSLVLTLLLLLAIDKAKNIFKRLDIKTFVTDIYYGKYQIIEKVK